MSNYKYKYIHVFLLCVSEVLQNVTSAKLDGLRLGQYCEKTCTPLSLQCDYNKCQCAEDYIEKNGECLRTGCSADYEVCYSDVECCGYPDSACSTGRECITIQNSDPVFFMSATQIILSTTMVMGILALCTIFWRLCLRKSPISGRRGHTQIRERLSAGRASLNSIQRRVLTRMRDRPPQYTAQNNLPSPDIRTNSESFQTRPNTLHPPPYDGPPTYEDSQSGSNTPINEPPPPYDPALMDICSTGVINPAFAREVSDSNNNTNSTNTDSAKQEEDRTRPAGINVEMHI